MTSLMSVPSPPPEIDNDPVVVSDLTDSVDDLGRLLSSTAHVEHWAPPTNRFPLVVASDDEDGQCGSGIEHDDDNDAKDVYYSSQASTSSADESSGLESVAGTPTSLASADEFCWNSGNSADVVAPERPPIVVLREKKATSPLKTQPTPPLDLRRWSTVSTQRPQDAANCDCTSIAFSTLRGSKKRRQLKAAADDDTYRKASSSATDPPDSPDSGVDSSSNTSTTSCDSNSRTPRRPTSTTSATSLLPKSPSKRSSSASVTRATAATSNNVSAPMQGRRRSKSALSVFFDSFMYKMFRVQRSKGSVAASTSREGVGNGVGIEKAAVSESPTNYSPRWRDDPTNEASPLAWNATNNNGTTSASSAPSQTAANIISKEIDRQRQLTTTPINTPITLHQPRATTAKTITLDETPVSQGVSAVIPSGASPRHSTASLRIAASPVMPPLPKLTANFVGKLANAPRFHFPAGKPVSRADNDGILSRIGTFITSTPTKTVTPKDFDEIARKLGLPVYCKQAIYEACCRVNAQNPEDTPAITFSTFAKYFTTMVDSAHDEEARFIFTLSVAAHGLPARKFLTREDFHSIFYDLIETYPGLKFLIDSKQFHARYVEVVVARIFWNVNRSWTGKLTYAELKKSNLLATMHLLETTDEINKITDYFSYEHFYVTYCKFWEIDVDHLMVLTRENMRNHNGGALTDRIIDRIFSPAVTRIPSQQAAARKNGRGPVKEERIETIGFEEFVAFLLAEEDKRHPTSIEYWFRCLDLDGDGIISMYEMELFYDDIVAKIHQKGFETLAFSDVANQLIDLVNPKDGNIRLSDLKTCGLAHRFFNTFVNYMKYLEQESADGERASVKMNGDKEMSDWEQFCAVEYEILMSETENGDDLNDEAYDVNLDDDENGPLETTYSLDNNVVSSLSVGGDF
uniref:EF-hand domain-containing protein n=1 Tax=Panagrellus redivivus TaxID=6233 RepID=A0A7E5A0H1_PANRE